MPVAEKSETFILDNGGYSIKAGYASQSKPRHNKLNDIPIDSRYTYKEIDRYECKREREHAKKGVLAKKLAINKIICFHSKKVLLVWFNFVIKSLCFAKIFFLVSLYISL